ncbi:MAG: CDGSH iron-sulfur domain-containing protein [Vampirovibrio sp.]|jgi:CDGSH-type Zn-finger protein|nr:CDGSH iron-sulfur domain-containing protein [Vampirovibrio sp.]
MSTPYLPHCFAASPEEHTLPVGNYAWCSCGLSADGVFCDGAHKGTTFRPTIMKITDQPETCTLCRCKRTNTAPFCDGSHINL